MFQFLAKITEWTSSIQGTGAFLFCEIFNDETVRDESENGLTTKYF